LDQLVAIWLESVSRRGSETLASGLKGIHGNHSIFSVSETPLREFESDFQGGLIFLDGMLYFWGSVPGSDPPEPRTGPISIGSFPNSYGLPSPGLTIIIHKVINNI